MPGFGSLFPMLEGVENWLKPTAMGARAAGSTGATFGSMAPAAEPDDAELRKTADLPGGGALEAPQPYYDPGGAPPMGPPDKYQPPAPPKPRPTWMMEPDLMQTQMGQLPPGVELDESGQPRYSDTGEPLKVVRRPGVLPIAKTPDGYTLTTPKIAELAQYIVGGAVPEAGGMVLGAGAARVAKAAKVAKAAEEAPAPLAIKDAVPAPPPDPGMVRVYRGGTANQPGDTKWVTTNQKYAEGYTTPGLAYHPKSGSYLQYADVPATDPRVQMPPGQSTHSFEAPADIASQLKPYYQPKTPGAAAQDAVTAKLGPVPGAHPDEQALNVNSILHPDTPALPARSQNVEEIAGYLQNRGQAALKNLGIESGQINESHPVHDELVARQMAAEVEAALNRGGKTAQDWYTKSIDEAIDHANDIWPGLKDDPHQRLGFTAALAITSQGENVQNNVRLAEKAYQQFRDTGRFPTDMVVNKPKYINGNFQKMNDLLDTMTPEQLHDFMHSDFKVKELEDMGHPIGDENKGTTVKGSAILGSKIGGGFFQNLNRNYNPVTMDMWFMRALGRLQGTLVGRPSAMPKATARLVAALKDEGITVPRDPQKLSDLADQTVTNWEREFRTNRDKYNSGERTKPELAKAAERFQANKSGINETPLSGGHRLWIRSIVNRANDILKSRGHNLTNADMQAIWWYPEKELYSKLGGVDSEALNTDYATELRNLKARRAAGAQP